MKSSPSVHSGCFILVLVYMRDVVFAMECKLYYSVSLTKFVSTHFFAILYHTAVAKFDIQSMAIITN